MPERSENLLSVACSTAVSSDVVIAGLQRCSFVDYPGRLSAVVFLQGCNLRCPYCHNSSLIPRHASSAIYDSELMYFLASRRGRLDGVVITGGEPTLHPGLRSLIEAVRDLGFSVKLDTNGTRPDVLAELIGCGLLDYVALDLKDEPHAYSQWLGMQEGPDVLHGSLEIVKTSQVDHELRTTVLMPYHDKERLGRMAQWAVGSAKWILQPYNGSDYGVPSTKFLVDTSKEISAKYGVLCHSRVKT